MLRREHHQWLPDSQRRASSTSSFAACSRSPARSSANTDAASGAGRTLRRPDDLCSRRLTQQEVERCAVERLRVLVQPSMREMIEHYEVASGDAVLERLGEACGADKVVRSEGDQG